MELSRLTYTGNADFLPDFAVMEIEKILNECEISEAEITSSKRTPHDQARIMYQNLEQYGSNAQKKLYKAAGRQIIDVYLHAKARGMKSDAIIMAMETKIKEIGPETISAHCSLDPKKAVFDLAPNNIPKEKKTLFEVKVSDSKLVTKFLKPPIDPAYHLEMHEPEAV